MRDRALIVRVLILKIFSKGGEGPAFRPGWVQIKTVENRRGSGPPLPTPSGFAHDVGDNISYQMTTSVLGKKNQYEILLDCRVHMHNLHLGANLLPGANYSRIQICIPLRRVHIGYMYLDLI